METRNKLLAKNRKLLKKVMVQLDGEEVPVDLRKPSMGERLSVLEKAREAGEVDAQNQPTSEKAGVNMLARVATVVMYEPATGKPLFTDAHMDAIVDEVWLEELREELMGAFGVSSETARGNSSATPS